MIREANKFDIPEIIDLLKQVNLIHHQGRPDIFNIGTKYTKEELEQLIDDEQKPIYVFIDNKILGYAFCIIKEIKDDNILVNRRELYIDDLCVLESNRGNHIGTSLFSNVKEIFQHTHTKRLSKTSGTSNQCNFCWFFPQYFRNQTGFIYIVVSVFFFFF